MQNIAFLAHAYTWDEVASTPARNILLRDIARCVKKQGLQMQPAHLAQILGHLSAVYHPTDDSDYHYSDFSRSPGTSTHTFSPRLSGTPYLSDIDSATRAWPASELPADTSPMVALPHTGASHTSDAAGSVPYSPGADVRSAAGGTARSSLGDLEDSGVAEPAATDVHALEAADARLFAVHMQVDEAAVQAALVDALRSLNTPVRSRAMLFTV